MAYWEVFLINLNNFKIEIPCPKCGFYITFFFKQACNNEIIICGGCKSNVQLFDHMDECKNARKIFNRSMKKLKNIFKNFEN